MKIMKIACLLYNQDVKLLPIYLKSENFSDLDTVTDSAATETNPSEPTSCQSNDKGSNSKAASDIKTRFLIDCERIYRDFYFSSSENGW